jgi:hypothetical protein
MTTPSVADADTDQETAKQRAKDTKVRRLVQEHLDSDSRVDSFHCIVVFPREDLPASIQKRSLVSILTD